MHWLWVGTFSRIDNKVCSEKAMSFCSHKYFQTRLFCVLDETILANYSSLRISESYYVIDIQDILHTAWMSIPGMLGNYTIPEQKYFLKFWGWFLRKSYLTTFIHLNKLFDGAKSTLWGLISVLCSQAPLWTIVFASISCKIAIFNTIEITGFRFHSIPI